MGLERLVPEGRNRVRTAKVAVSLSLVALAFVGTYDSAPNAFAVHDVLGISFLALVVNSVLLAVALFFRSRLLANAWTAGTVLFGVLTMYVVHTSIYRDDWFLLGALSTVAYATLLVAYRAIDDHPWVGAVLATVASLGISAILLSVLGSTVSSSASTAERELPDVSFSEKPNVYLLGFDGITPAALIGKFNTDTTSFHDLMRDRFRTFRNFFSNHEHTQASYNYMLSLGDDVFKRSHPGDVPYFSGIYDVGLFRLFRRNGYEITTIARGQYMGKRRGPYIDNYVTTHTHSVCGKLGGVAAVSFYGYCNIRPLIDPVWPIRRIEAARRIVKSMLQRSEFRKPQLVLAHVFLPGHAWHAWDEDDMSSFRHGYLRSAEISAGLLTQVVDHLEVHDPSAILFVFGDHGPWLTVSLNAHGNWRSTIPDRQATAAGVFPPQRCSAYLDPPVHRTAKYMTTLDVVYGIIRCLSSDDPLAKKYERMEWPLIRNHVHLSYGDFLYE